MSEIEKLMKFKKPEPLDHNDTKQIVAFSQLVDGHIKEEKKPINLERSLVPVKDAVVKDKNETEVVRDAKDEEDDDDEDELRLSFCQFFYGDLSSFKPGARRIKSEEEEVEPSKVPLHCLPYDLKVYDEPCLELLSQGSEKSPTEQTVKTISYAIKCERSQDLSNTQSKEKDEENNNNDNEAAEMSDPPSLIIQAKDVVVDRSPMLKRAKLGNKQRRVAVNLREGSAEAVTSSLLIGPGEDCDDSDDTEETVEIDCDR